MIFILFLILANESDISQRKKSKLFFQFNEIQNDILNNDKNINKEEVLINYNYEEDNFDLNSNCDSSEINHYLYNNIWNFNKFKKFEVFCYIKVNKEKYFIFPINSDSINLKTHTVYDLIKNIVKKFNQNNINIKSDIINYNISLKDCEDEANKNFYINNYELRPSNKKDGSPKFDLPCYSHDSLLTNISNEKISFVVKDPLNIMMIEKAENSIDAKLIEECICKIDKDLSKNYKRSILDRKNKKCNNNFCRFNCLII